MDGNVTSLLSVLLIFFSFLSLIFFFKKNVSLSVLGNVMEKPLRAIFSEFHGSAVAEDDLVDAVWGGSGDVKYHLGTSTDRVLDNGKKVLRFISRVLLLSFSLLKFLSSHSPDPLVIDCQPVALGSCESCC